MPSDVPLAAALAVVLVVNVALTWFLGSRLADDADARPRPARVDRRRETVECPACGAANDLDYRFCRGCVEKLPTAAGSVDTAVRPVRGDLN